MEIDKYLPAELVKKSISLSSIGLDEDAWSKDTAKLVIEYLMFKNIGVLGGDVYKVDFQKTIPLYDNWYCEKDSSESESDFFLRSKQEALRYIDQYPISEGENIIFSLVFAFSHRA